MSTQASVESIQALRDFRMALLVFSEDAAAALGSVDLELKRTMLWLQHDRKVFWIEQLKRRRERVAQAKAEVFRRQLQKTPENSPSMTEQKELLRKAEESLRDAELRVNLVKKWEQSLTQAVFEYHGSTRRIKDLASMDALRAARFLEKLIDKLEAYLREAPPQGMANLAPIASFASRLLDEAEAEDAVETAAAEAAPEESARGENEAAAAADPEPESATPD